MNKKRINRKHLSLALMIMFLFLAVEVSAAGGISIYTTYPSIVVKPGENIETAITVSNTTGIGREIEMKILSMPENWEAYLEGGGRIIDRVHVTKDNAIIYLNVKVPKEAEEGDYTVVLEASSGGYSDRLNMRYTIKSDIENKGDIETNYKELKGSSNTSFKYELKIKNNKNDSQTYSLGAEVDRGWQVKFTEKYDSKEIASIPIEANGTANLEVEIKPPATITAGEYTIPIAAVSSGEILRTDVKVIITGTYGMKVTTVTGRLNAETTAGRKETIDIVIENTGSTELRNIKLSSWQPSGWEVEFDKENIDVIAAGESETIKTTIIPDEKALVGDYVVEISAKTPEVTSSAEIRVMVKTSTLWGLVAIGVIALLAFGLYKIFKTYGRR
ncbi:MAG: hypothetical protein GX201_12095 [Clostridiales bacterium]|nr:hypothetical protein [Clostridiales bacterium]